MKRLGKWIRRHPWITAGSALFLLAATLACVLVWVGMRTVYESVTDRVDLPIIELQAEGQFTLPADAKDVHSHLVAWQEATLSTKFTIQPADVHALMKSSICQLRDITTQPATEFDIPNFNKDDWWPHELPKKYIYAYGETAAYIQRILIEEGDPNLYTVYLSMDEK